MNLRKQYAIKHVNKFAKPDNIHQICKQLNRLS